MTVDICGDISLFRVAVDLDVDRMLQVVLEDQVQISTGHGGSIGKGNIVHRKSVIIPLYDLDLRPEKRII